MFNSKYYLNMKRFLFFTVMALALLMPVRAATPPVANPANSPSALLISPQQLFLPDDGEQSGFGLTTFTGIVALVSLLVTQTAKKIPRIGEKTILKILVSTAAGLLLTCLARWLGVAPFLENTVWWQVSIQGVFAGLSACGLYDLLKGLGILATD